MGLTIAVFSIFGLGVLAPWLHRLTGRLTGWIAATLPVALFVWFAGLARAVVVEGPMRVSVAWAPSLGLDLAFHLDGLSLLFAFLICGIGALVLIYSGAYMAQDPQLGRFYLYLLLFMGSMLGLVLADNAIALFVFWELTSVSSYLLIGFHHARPAARAAALQALLVTAGGGLALLAGLVLLTQMTGTPLVSDWHAGAAVIQGHQLYAPVLILVLLGAFTKSAQFPFHFWLPGAMEAPSPVSAYLHSATMVKAGVYLLARLHPALGGTDLWVAIVSTAGALTMVLGAVLALRQTDLKRILAFSTVSVLGLLVHLLGVGTELAVSAAMVYLLAHALYKGALFLLAGVVAHETGTRDVEQVSGLRRAMPITAAVGALAALSMAGLPPMFGFIGKEVLYEAVWGEGTALLVTGMAVVASVLLVAVAALSGFQPFLGRTVVAPRVPHDPPLAMWLGPALLAVAGLLAGLAPGFMDRWALTPAIEAVLHRDASLHLGLWHGFTPVLMLSLFTIGCGVVLYAARDAFVRGTGRAHGWLARVGPARAYDAGLAGLTRFAAWQAGRLQSGYMRAYLLIIMVATVALVGFTLVYEHGLAWPGDLADAQFHEVAIGVLILLAAFTAAVSRTGIAAVVAAGGVGFGVALIYVLFGAPDLAMTQFLIETLTVILFVLVFYHLPQFTGLSARSTRVRDAIVSLAAGGMITSLVLTASAFHSDSRLQPYFIEQSRPAAHGRNVVNVILVDFRGLDTLGEITVLAVAGIGVFALLKLRPGRGERR